MNPFRALIVLAAVATLGACSANGGLVARNALATDPLLTGEAPAGIVLSRDYKVSAIDVQVPDALVVSEANSYKPRADIVWHEDPIGDRRAQVDTIITNALSEGTAGMQGSRAVRLEVVVTRFHALTPKTRYTFGGTHDIRMVLSVYDAKTGELIEGPRPVGFEIPASGGDKALAEEAAGITQKVVITNALEEMIQAELG